MSEFVKVCAVSEIPDPGKMTAEVDETMVVLFHLEGQFYCLDDVCTHDGGPLGEGEFDGDQIACPRHGARFCVRSGDALTMPATQATVSHEVKVVEGQLFVKIKLS